MGRLASKLQKARIMENETPPRKQTNDELLNHQQRDEILRSLSVIRQQGKLLQSELEAESPDDDSLIERLREIEIQTQRINDLLNIACERAPSGSDD